MTEVPQPHVADRSWFHVFKDMIDSGDIVRMGTQAFAVYAVIKRHSAHTSGEAFPSIELISEKVGIVPRQVIRELKKLEDLGYLTKTKVGRRNNYVLREKITIYNLEGEPSAVATWDYVPQGIKDATADLRDVLLSGEFGKAKIVHIEHLTVNIARDNATQVVFNQAEFNKLPTEIQDMLMKIRSNIQPDLSTD